MGAYENTDALQSIFDKETISIRPADIEAFKQSCDELAVKYVEKADGFEISCSLSTAFRIGKMTQINKQLLISKQKIEALQESLPKEKELNRDESYLH